GCLPRQKIVLPIIARSPSSGAPSENPAEECVTHGRVTIFSHPYGSSQGARLPAQNVKARVPTMADRVKQILSFYASANPGVKNNLARMLMHGRLGGTGKMVILPVDQGFEHGPARSFGPNPDGYDPDYHFQLSIDAKCNAYAAPLGQLEAS